MVSVVRPNIGTGITLVKSVRSAAKISMNAKSWISDDRLAIPDSWCHLSRMDSTGNFDAKRFAKVWNFATSIPHDADSGNERTAARRRAEAMAARAGMTLDAAVSALKVRETAQRPDFRMPESFRWHPMEREIHRAGADMVSDDYPQSEEALRTIRHAVPMPRTIRAALSELEIWTGIETARQADAPGFTTGGTLRARFDMVAQFAASARATCTGEAIARAQWWANRIASGAPATAFDGVAALSIAEDMRRMADRVAVLTMGMGDRRPEPKPEPVPLRRTGAMKRADVLSILDEPGGDDLTLRQVADRAGVSPETVRRIKRERSAK